VHENADIEISGPFGVISNNGVLAPQAIFLLGLFPKQGVLEVLQILSEAVYFAIRVL
jgi:hypothetical protein